jgi:Sulfatase
MIDPDTFSGQQRARIEGIFESVEALAAEREQRPKFVFAHVPSPHAPWVVHADGSPRIASNLETVYWDTPETTGLTRDEIVAAYTGQVGYLDQRALDAIDGILAHAERPPVILVISDHGSSLDVTVNNAETRLRNLVAVYTPGHPGLYPDDATLVNLFPTLFDAYFGVELPRSPDTLFTQGPNGLFDPIPIGS